MMFQRILVPLDGSTRAESALPVAVRLAQQSGGSVILLYVAEPPVSSGKFRAPQAYPHAATEKELAEASAYLQTLAQSAQLSGISSEVHTLAGGVASTILSATPSLHADLIVMSSHGYTGFKRWALGSVAHKLIPHSPVPVLVLRDGGPVPATTAGQPAHVVVPLDGSPLSESALEPAAQLVSALAPAGQRTVQLLRVVDIPPSYGKFRGMVDAYYDSERRAEAKHEDELYLAAVAKRFSEGQLGQYQLAVTTTVVIDPDVARAIEQVAEQAAEAHPSSSHLIVMATHGRGGLSHWMLGSVAERVLHASRLPLLVVHAANSSVL
jgi:nucleotide-binding universal stress UspA family protein